MCLGSQPVRPTAMPTLIRTDTVLQTLLLSLLPLCIISIVVILIVLLWRRRAAMAYSQRLPTQEPAPHPSPHLGETNHSVLLINKIEIKACGRLAAYGSRRSLEEVISWPSRFGIRFCVENYFFYKSNLAFSYRYLVFYELSVTFCDKEI